ncbi:hypothetical protein HPB52_011858 [Rhipicephalus sanguineus]|uniref:HTH psq-type domain-containing protein n=1 Tax=Rhipicephalus sanguineus TaxID=34632 RepID=A0A9D4PZH0_RHISA|nr:hypothetical protein HPB52_011858 [Rhipicephalus sanguineus]
MFATAAGTGTRRCLATRGLGRFSHSRLVEACKSNRPTAVLPFSHSFTCLPHRAASRNVAEPKTADARRKASHNRGGREAERSKKDSIARDLNIPESSLKTILAKKDSILLNAAKFGLNRNAAKDGKYAAMEKALVEWLRQARSSGIARRLAGMEHKQLDKKLPVLDAMHYIASAWDAVTPETIANSFRHCGFNRSGACSTSEAALPVDDEPEFGSLELPGSFADYVGADDDVAVCSEASLDDIIETVRPDTAGTSDEEEMDDAAEASVSVPTYADVLCYVDHIRRFACARDEIGDLLPDVAAIERKLMPTKFGVLAG